MKTRNNAICTLIAIAVLFALLILIGCASPTKFTPPVVGVDKTVSKTTIQPGEYFTATIKVTGDEVEQTDPVPTSVVLVLDESGSMTDIYLGKPLYESSRAAAKDVIKILRPNIDKVALITFSSSATLKVVLTSNFSIVTSAINNLGTPAGQTNMSAAFDLANSELINDVSYNKIVILFTDGVPYPDPFKQISDITKKIDVPQKYHIQYFTIGFGTDLSEFLLKDILANRTGGSYSNTSDPATLTALFQKAFTTVSNTLFARDVTIREALMSEFEVKPTSLKYSFTNLPEDNNFKAAMSAKEKNFYTSGEIEFPAIPILAKQRLFTFEFEVTSKKCKTQKQNLALEDLTKSEVSYNFGTTPAQVIKLPQKVITLGACGLTVLKRFDPATLTVTIELINSFSDQTLEDIGVYELTTDQFESLINTAVPPAVPNPLITTVKKGLHWKLNSLGPGKTAAFSFKVIPHIKAGEIPPFVINAKSLTADVEFVVYTFKDANGNKAQGVVDMPGLETMYVLP